MVFGLLLLDIFGGLVLIVMLLLDMFMFIIEGGGLSLVEWCMLLDWIICLVLCMIFGVVDFNVFGG